MKKYMMLLSIVCSVSAVQAMKLTRVSKKICQTHIMQKRTKSGFDAFDSHYLERVANALEKQNELLQKQNEIAQEKNMLLFLNTLNARSRSAPQTTTDLYVEKFNEQLLESYREHFQAMIADRSGKKE